MTKFMQNFPDLYRIWSWSNDSWGVAPWEGVRHGIFQDFEYDPLAGEECPPARERDRRRKWEGSEAKD